MTSGDHPIIVLGGGGHGKVLMDILILNRHQILGVTDPGLPQGSTVSGVPVLGDDKVLESHPPGTVRLANGLGAVPTEGQVGDSRRRIFQKFKAQGYSFTTVVHPLFNRRLVERLR